MNIIIPISKMLKTISTFLLAVFIWGCNNDVTEMAEKENLIQIKTSDLFSTNTTVELLDTVSNKTLRFSFRDSDQFSIGYSKTEKYIGPYWHFAGNRLTEYILFGEDYKRLEVYEYDEFGKLVLIEKNGKAIFDERNEPPVPEN